MWVLVLGRRRFLDLLATLSRKEKIWGKRGGKKQKRPTHPTEAEAAIEAA
jgi:hypothetical protein